MSTLKREGIIILKENRLGLKDFDNVELDKITRFYNLDMAVKVEGFNLERASADQLNSSEAVKRFIDKNVENILAAGSQDSDVDCVCLIVETDNSDVVKMLHHGLPYAPYYSMKMIENNGNFKYISVCDF